MTGERARADPALAELVARADPRAIDALLAAMADDDLGVRLAAADALGAVGRPALIMLLRRLITRQAGAPFREAAARALLPLAVAAPRPDVAVLETALRGPAAESTVPVAADKLLRRCEVRAALSC